MGKYDVLKDSAIVEKLVTCFDAKHLKTPTCWLWYGTCEVGYGVMHIPTMRGLRLKAHIFIYMLTHHLTDKPKLMILHRCGVRQCVNPDHLYAGNARDNALDYQQMRSD